MKKFTLNILKDYPIVVSALMLGLVFQREILGLLVFIGLAPFLSFLENTRQSKFFKSWLGGFLFSAIVIHWFLANSPSAWAGISGWETKIAHIFVWLGSAAIFGLNWGLFAWLFRLIKTGGAFDFLTIPSAWILGEYFKALLFSFFFWGQGAALGPYWTFGHLGYAAPQFFLAGRLVGLYGLSFMIVLINLVFLRLIKKTADLKTVFAVAASVALLVAGGRALIGGEGTTKIRVAALQLQSQSRADIFWLQDIINQKKVEGVLPLDVFVAPENSRLFPNFKEKEMFQSLLNKTGVSVSSAYKFDELGRRFGSISYQAASGRLISRQQKTFLIPAGEFMPKNLEWFFRLANPKLLQRFNQLRKIERGADEERLVAYGGLRLAALSCSGVIAPSFYRNLTKQGAQILINSASQEIIRGSEAFHGQIKSMALWHAVANARPFVQSANGGFSYLIDKDGRFIGRSDKIKDDIIVGDLTLENRLTPYSLFGEWMIAAAFLIVLGKIGGLFLNKRKR